MEFGSFVPDSYLQLLHSGAVFLDYLLMHPQVLTLLHNVVPDYFTDTASRIAVTSMLAAIVAEHGPQYDIDISTLPLDLDEDAHQYEALRYRLEALRHRLEAIVARIAAAALKLMLLGLGNGDYVGICIYSSWSWLEC